MISNFGIYKYNCNGFVMLHLDLWCTKLKKTTSQRQSNIDKSNNENEQMLSIEKKREQRNRV